MLLCEFFPFFLIFSVSVSKKDKILLISTFGGISLIGILIIIIALAYKFCCKNKKYKKKKGNQMLSEKNLEPLDPNESLNTSLIPPLFFTQGIQDPIYQADLVDNIKAIKK